MSSILSWRHGITGKVNVTQFSFFVVPSSSSRRQGKWNGRKPEVRVWRTWCVCNLAQIFMSNNFRLMAVPQVQNWFRLQNSKHYTRGFIWWNWRFYPVNINRKSEIPCMRVTLSINRITRLWTTPWFVK